MPPAGSSEVARSLHPAASRRLDQQEIEILEES